MTGTFRVRRRNKRAKSQTFPRSFALQALAIRENKIHVQGSYAVPSSPTSIYLDIEGLPDRNSYYLIGLVVVDKVLGRAVNVLSIIHPHVYFPTHSCSLKDIGRSIGCVWAAIPVSRGNPGQRSKFHDPQYIEPMKQGKDK
jgi:predicted RecB family nuclease